MFFKTINNTQRKGRRKHLSTLIMFFLLFMHINLLAQTTHTYSYQILTLANKPALTIKNVSAPGGGDADTYLPNTYKSPLAKNFTYYTSNALADKSTSQITVLPDEDATIYVRYEYDYDAAETAGLTETGIYNMKCANSDLYFYYYGQNTGAGTSYNWGANAMARTLRTGEDGSEGWYLFKIKIFDPYEVTIQTQDETLASLDDSPKELVGHYDYYLTTSNKAQYDPNDIRWNTLDVAKARKVWAFAILNGASTESYRFVVADNFSSNRTDRGLDDQGHSYLNYGPRGNPTGTICGEYSWYQFASAYRDFNLIVPSASKIIRVTFKLDTKFGDKHFSMSEMDVIGSNIHLPESMKQRYCTYKFYSRYSEDGTIDYGEDEDNWVEVTKYPNRTSGTDKPASITIRVKYDISDDCPIAFSDEVLENEDAMSWNFIHIDFKGYNNYDRNRLIREPGETNYWWTQNDKVYMYNNSMTYAFDYQHIMESEFKEKRWLWAFVGDPYYYYLYNRQRQEYVTVSETATSSQYALSFSSTPEEESAFKIDKHILYTSEEDPHFTITLTRDDKTVYLWHNNNNTNLQIYMADDTPTADNAILTHKYTPYKWESVRIHLRGADGIDILTFESKSSERIYRELAGVETDGNNIYIKNLDITVVGGNMGSEQTWKNTRQTTWMRKFCNYTLYQDDAMTIPFEGNAMTMGTGHETDENYLDIYIKYTFEGPFMFSEDNDDTAIWYILDMNFRDFLSVDGTESGLETAAANHRIIKMPDHTNDHFVRDANTEEFYNLDSYDILTDPAKTIANPDNGEQESYATYISDAVEEKRNTSGQNITDQYLWAFVGNPYHFKIINKEEGAGKYLTSRNANNHSVVSFDYTGDINDWTVYYTTDFNTANEENLPDQFIIAKADDLNMSLMTNPSFRNIRLRWNNSDGNRAHNIKAWLYSPNISVFLNIKLYDESGTWVRDYEFTPADNIKIQTILSPTSLPDIVQRKYCDYRLYTVNSYMNDYSELNGGDDHERKLTDDFTTPDLSTREQNVVVLNKLPYAKNDIEKTTPQIHTVYVKYNFIEEAADKLHDGNDIIPFRLYDTLADVPYREVTDTLLNCVNPGTETGWYFLELDIDGANNVSYGDKRYFLKVNDSGNGIDFLNPEDAADRLTEIDTEGKTDLTGNVLDGYTRKAETWRNNDHDTFHEDRWLWAFVGKDPYNVQIINKSRPNEYLTLTRSPKYNSSGVAIEDEYTYKVTFTSDETDENALWGFRMSGVCDDPTVGDPDLENQTSFSIGNENMLELLWNYATYYNSTTTSGGSTTGQEQSAVLSDIRRNTTNLAFTLKAFPYIPTQYQDVMIVIRRDHDAYDHAMLKDDSNTTGISEMYYASSSREFVYGDIIERKTDADDNDVESIPLNLRRKFCKYTLFSDYYDTPGDYEVKDGPLRYYNSDTGNYDYYIVTTDGSGARVIQPVSQSTSGWPQKMYASYSVTSDIFLRTAPTEAEVKEMSENNDHVYFMDFPDPNVLKGKELDYKTGYHAYYSPTTTFRDLIGLSDEELTRRKVYSERLKWTGTNFVNDLDKRYNSWNFRNTGNRMETVPENLKWYFVGDPYAVQIYNVAGNWIGGKAANLCRINPANTNFQLVADCVTLNVPDPSVIDTRVQVPIYINNTDTKEREIIGYQDNENYGKPIYGNFYWEMVPSASSAADDDDFALRFKANNNILNYNNVYYYLANQNLSRKYSESILDENVSYHTNLCYQETNDIYLGGTYKGYHKANNDTTIIRLTIPTKVYVSAYKDTGASSYSETNKITTDELSEYYGFGEKIAEVPRHLQRKFVAYSDMTNIKTGNALAEHELSETNADYYTADCTAHTEANGKAFIDGSPCNTAFKFKVLYTIDDVTNPEAAAEDQIHIFTSADELSKGADAYPTWLDVMTGNRYNSATDHYWLYYDKLKSDTNADMVSDFPALMQDKQDYPNMGWDTGLKGLHWAFIGDPYNFTMLNRRKWEDSGKTLTGLQWLGTGYAKTTETINDVDTEVWYNYAKLGNSDECNDYGRDGSGGNTGNGNTEWSLMYCKTGGDADYFIRTSTRKTTSDDVNNDHTDAFGTRDNVTNDYEMLYRYISPSGSLMPFIPDDVPADSAFFVTSRFSLSLKTDSIQKAVIRTVTNLDNDKAANDCFDANVKIYNTKGELRASMDHVELSYKDVFEAMPYTLRRYGCEYIQCWINEYGTTNAIKIADTDENISATFSDGVLYDSSTIFKTEDGVKYIEIAYVYRVDEDVMEFFTSVSDAKQDEYNWSNAYFEWEQTYSGTNVRVVNYKDVFDYYIYSPDGHIIDEVWHKEETIGYQSGTFSTAIQGWANSKTSQYRTYGDQGTQTDADAQKWSLIGDPYNFEFKNYDKYLSNPNSSLTYDETGYITFSNTSKSHWAIVQGPQQYTYEDGVKKLIWKDEEKTIPQYIYYLALIDDDETSGTYGTAINYITFERVLNNKDLPAEEQYLYPLGGPNYNTDPTGNLYTDTKNGKTVKPFYLTDLLYHASAVIYHLVIAHQNSVDYEDTFANMATDEEKNEAKQIIDNHLLEHLKYNYPEYLNSDFSDINDTYLKPETDITPDPTGYTAIKERLTDEGRAMLKEALRKTSLRDVVNDSISDYYVAEVPIGNRLGVPWYMKRQFCNYRLFQRDVLRSQTTDRPMYELADDDWEGATVTIDGKIYKVDENGDRIQMVGSNGELLYEVDWISVTAAKPDGSYSSDKEEVEETNGKEITRLSSIHKGRRILVDVVYSVNPKEFRFADKGRNTTAWYSMLTYNDADGLMNFTYKDGIGARHGRDVHYTNNYLWAPDGDPYGFVLHNRYATVNGTGWDHVVITNTGHLPDITDAESGTVDMTKIGKITLDPLINDGSADITTESDRDYITYTGAVSNARFVRNRIVHYKPGFQRPDGSVIRTWAARNSVYEMIIGDYDNSFIMHPTSAYINIDGNKFSSFYVKHITTPGDDFHKAEIIYANDATVLKSDKDANWRLFTTPEQLLPYFDRSGYVGGLTPTIANNYVNLNLYEQLQTMKANYRTNPEAINFETIDKIRNLVYSGKFYYRNPDGTYTNTIDYDHERPGGYVNSNDSLPLKFVSDNLIPIAQGYYRIKALSRTALDNDGEDVDGSGLTGITGPRYISGYRFKSEKDYEGFDDGGNLESGSCWLHFFETDEEHSSFKTFGELNDLISQLNSQDDFNRNILPHPALRGNIPILPAEYDPSSIFFFQPAEPESGQQVERYSRFNFGTQNLWVRGRAGGVKDTDYEYEDDDDINTSEIYGVTKLVDLLSGPGEDQGVGKGTFDDRFRIDDIGGTAVTLRILEEEEGNWDEINSENMKTNYLCIDANHRYQVTIHKNNEMKEIGDSYDHLSSTDYWTLGDINYGIQDTKWLLQPVGVKNSWPFNEMPLSVEVHKGDRKNADLYTSDEWSAMSASEQTLADQANIDNNYYASLYVPFDSKLKSTIDVAFTNLKERPQPTRITLNSVSQLNNMGNPQFIPAGWPVILRTSSPITTITKEDGTTMASTPHVDLFLPNKTKTSIPDNFEKFHLWGEYLEQELTDDIIYEKTGKDAGDWTIHPTVMVFGLPFKETGNNTKTLGAEEWYEYKDRSAVGFYINENWARGHTDYTTLTTNDATITTAHWATQEDATKYQRGNRYVYANRAYFVYDCEENPGEGIKIRFDGDDWDDQKDKDIDDDLNGDSNTWPCDVYDLQGRKVATGETPESLRVNHPNLPKGIYIFSGKKVMVM